MRAAWRISAAALAAAGLGASACSSPTVTLATQEPIEIRIDLHHEVRVQIDREVSDMIGAETQREAIVSRGGARSDERAVREAKARGVIGEGADGYLGVRSVAPVSVDERGLVERVNRERADAYQALAEDYHVERVEIEKLAGAKRIRAAEDGEVVRAPGGQWVHADEAEVVVVEGEDPEE